MTGSIQGKQKKWGKSRDTCENHENLQNRNILRESNYDKIEFIHYFKISRADVIIRKVATPFFFPTGWIKSLFE